MEFTTAITNAGNGISLQTLFDKGDIVFTRIEIGNQVNDTPATAVSLASPKIVGQFLGIERDEENNTALLRFVFDNRSVVDSFSFREYGIFATYTNDKGDRVDCLYAYGYTEVEGAMTIPAFTTPATYLKEKLTFTIGIGTPDNVSVYLGEYEDYASKEELENHINDSNNPHDVNARDVGLENVENVSTNDARPTFTEAEELQEINSGEKVTILWGKTKKAIKNLKEHIDDKTSNPHKVTLKHITGAENLNELLRKLITDSAQHIILAAGRYIYGTDGTGTSHQFCGLWAKDGPFFGSEDYNYTHVHGNNICIRLVNSASKYFYWYFSSGGHFYPSSTDSCVGTTSRKINRVYAVNAYSSSDRKEKENITDCEIGLAILERISFKEFNFKDKDEKSVGVIAQEIFQLFQELGIHNSSVYSVAVKGNDPAKHPERENLTDEQILSYPDEKLIWTVDYQQIADYCIAGFKQYMSNTDSRLDTIEKTLTEVLGNE